MPLKNPEKRKAYRKKHYLANREKLLSEFAQRYKKNAEEIRATSNKHYHKNKERIQARRRLLNTMNPSQKSGWNKTYRALHKEEISKKNRGNRPAINKRNRQHYATDGDGVRARNQSKNKGWEFVPERGNRWDYFGDQILIESKVSDKKTAKKLGRSLFSIRSRRSYLKKHGRSYSSLS